jgi:GDP-D-mannose dehydratase
MRDWGHAKDYVEVSMKLYCVKFSISGKKDILLKRHYSLLLSSFQLVCFEEIVELL